MVIDVAIKLLFLFAQEKLDRLEKQPKNLKVLSNGLFFFRFSPQSDLSLPMEKSIL